MALLSREKNGGRIFPRSLSLRLLLVPSFFHLRASLSLHFVPSLVVSSSALHVSILLNAPERAGKGNEG